MNDILNYLLQVISQFAGGPGKMENNLVRFTIPAILWGALLLIARARQHEHVLPREKLLVWGFGLGLVSSLLMIGFVSLQMLDAIDREVTYPYLVPVDRALAMASIVVVASAFLRYILDDLRIAQMYLRTSVGITGLCLALAFWQWPNAISIVSEERFHTVWSAWLFEVSLSVLLVVAILLLRQKPSWLSRVVTIALMFFLMRELLTMLNYATDESFNHIICPVSNSLRILAIPILGYVYLREQSIEKKNNEADLKAYRQHLEKLVEERTAEISSVNEKLQEEVIERKKMEEIIAQRNADLAVQTTIASTISRSLDLTTILNTSLDTVLTVLEMDVGLVYLKDSLTNELSLENCRGNFLKIESDHSSRNWTCCLAISQEAIELMETVAHRSENYPCTYPESNILEQGLKVLISVPLISKNIAVGALTLGLRKSDPIPQSTLNLLTAIGQQIGMAIDNSHLYQQSERTAKELTILHQMSVVLTSTLNSEKIYQQIVEQSTKLINCQKAFILTYDEENLKSKLISAYGLNEVESEYLTSFPDIQRSLSELLNQQRSLIIQNQKDNPGIPPEWLNKLNIETMLLVPILDLKEAFGILCLINRNHSQLWRPQEVELVESFVNRAAVALMNANLVKQIEWAAALEERQRIAADMHDGVAQSISLLGLQIDDVTDSIQNSRYQSALEQLSHSRSIIENVSEDVRKSIASLHGSPQPLRSIQDLLTELVSRIPVDNHLKINTYFYVDNPVYLSPDQRGQIILVVQEAIINAHRHAAADNINMIVKRINDHLSIIVEDDGIGFDSNEWWGKSKTHFGLGIIHARAARIGANLKLDSTPGEGTRVTINLPFQENLSPNLVNVTPMNLNSQSITSSGIKNE